MHVEIISAIFDWISKQQVNLSLFLFDWYYWKLGLTSLPGHDGKSASDVNLISSFYERL